MSESNAVVERKQEFAAKQKQLEDVFTAARDGERYDFSRDSVHALLGSKDAADALAKVKSRNLELTALGQALGQAEAAEIDANVKAIGDARKQPYQMIVHGGAAPVDMKTRSFGELVIESKSFKGYNYRRDASVGIEVDVDLKTLFETSAGFAPESVRSGLIVPAAGARITFLNILPVRQVNQAVDKYMEQTTLTNNSAEKAEGVAYAESVFEYTERESPIRKITNSVPVTDEQLEDAPEVVPILNGDVVRGLRERLELQALVGDGTAPNIEGFLDAGKTGVQTQAKGTDPVFDAIFKALNEVRVDGDANPTHIVMHPTNWLAVRLARTADGQYIMGNPIIAGPETLFGLPVVLSTRITTGTALTGDFVNYSYIANKRGVDVQVGYVGDQFKEGKRTIRADLRAGLTVTRQAAFCKITGLI